MRTTMRIAAALLIASSISAGNPGKRNGMGVPSASKFDRYVSPSGKDSNEGSARRPWATLQHAAANARPGMTIHVAAGTYGAVTTAVSGSPIARIRFLSDTKWSAKIRSVGAYSAWTIRADYIDIIGFDVSGDGYIGIANWGSSVRMIANHVHHVPAPGCVANGGAGIVNANYSAHDNDIIGNVVHDIGDYNTFCTRVQGIYHSNLRGNIVNNISYRNQSYGIHLWHAATEVTVANNLVFNNHYGGIVIGAGDAPGGVINDYTVVVNNIVVHNLNRHGIEEFGAVGTHNIYRDNLVYANQWTDWDLRNGNKPVGTIKSNPQFIDYRPDGNGDYHLRPSSPALRAGTAIGVISFDIDGRDRLPSLFWDLGPYQSGAPMTHPYPHID